MLKEEIEQAKRSVTTDTVSMSVGEVASMYTSTELNILPEFQRLFRWTSERKANFIESILIGIPIPPAFAYENENGTWELIDGLQRISTILEFMGVLIDPDTGEQKRSKLVKTKYLPSLEGVVWQAQNETETNLDKSLQLFFRRHRIDFQILKHPSNVNTKFDLFQRLNRGGAYANEQEVRTCSMVLANLDATKKLRELAARQDFQQMFRVTEDQKKSQKDLEYAVRIISHLFKDLPHKVDVQEFLDKTILEIFSLEKEFVENYISTTAWAVSTLFDALGKDALIPPEERAEGISARFSLRALEGIVVGIARNREAVEAMPNMKDFISQRVSSFWQQADVQGMGVSGLRGTVRLQRSIPFGSDWFNPARA